MAVTTHLHYPADATDVRLGQARMVVDWLQDAVPTDAQLVMGATVAIGAGSEVMIAPMTDAWLLPSNARRPVAIS